MNNEIAQEPFKPIFVVGCPRSGTTLLQLLLDAHQAVAIAPETFFIERFWLKRELYGDLNNDENFENLIKNIAATPEFKEMELELNHFREAAWEKERTYASLFQLLLEQFAHLRGVKIVGEKTPNHLLYVETLQQFFPESRFIHIIRDPRAVVSSWKKVPWSKGSLEKDARVWRKYMRTAREYPSSMKSAIFTVQYENLIFETEKNLRAICHFLGLEYDPMMMSYYSKESKLVNVVREPWKANSKKPISRVAVERWKTELSPAQIVEIEKEVWDEMKRLGYQPENNIFYLFVIELPTKIKRKLNQYKQLITSLIKPIISPLLKRNSKSEA